MLDFDAVPWLRQLVAGLSPHRLGFDPWSFHARSVVDKVALGQFFSEYFGLFLSVPSTNAPYVSSYTYCSYNKDKRARPGSLPKSSALSEISERCIDKYRHLIFSERLDTKTDGLTNR